MSKPIFVVRFPSKAENKNLSEARESLSQLGFDNDYHCLVFKDQFTGGEIKFECYNAPHTDIEFKELQKRVLELLNKSN